MVDGSSWRELSALVGYVKVADFAFSVGLKSQRSDRYAVVSKELGGSSESGLESQIGRAHV